jgi:hypothetical protein
MLESTQVDSIGLGCPTQVFYRGTGCILKLNLFRKVNVDYRQNTSLITN